jgi:hypothetical protein
MTASSLLATAAAASAATTSDVAYSRNWAGWAVTGNTFKYVATTFTVPHVSCTGVNEHFSMWVGLDGKEATDPGLVQAGVEVDCNAPGPLPVYHAFWEQLPALQHQLSPKTFPVTPGEQIKVIVNYDDSLHNLNWMLGGYDSHGILDHFASGAFANGSRRLSAECIVESTLVVSGKTVRPATLPHFGQANFTNGCAIDTVAVNPSWQSPRYDIVGSLHRYPGVTSPLISGNVHKEILNTTGARIGTVRATPSTENPQNDAWQVVQKTS